MPIDLLVEFENGKKAYYYIPNTLMRWEKLSPYPTIPNTVLAGWDWAIPTYSIEVAKDLGVIKSVIIDPSDLMADVKKDDNQYPKK